MDKWFSDTILNICRFGATEFTEFAGAFRISRGQTKRDGHRGIEDFGLDGNLGDLEDPVAGKCLTPHEGPGQLIVFAPDCPRYRVVEIRIRDLALSRLGWVSIGLGINTARFPTRGVFREREHK